MSAKWVRYLIAAIYLIVGVVLAWDNGYLGFAWLRTFFSAVLAILFWWLIPLGVNLHIHA